MLRVSILGSVVADRDDETVEIRGRSGRTVLARLVLAQGRIVTVDQLCDALWGDEPPDRPTASLQAVISRLRSGLGADAIVSEGGGYRLDTTVVATDLDAVMAVDRDQHDVTSLEATLDLWRGEPLADVAWTPEFEPHRAHLALVRSDLESRRLDAQLRTSRRRPWTPPSNSFVGRDREIERATAAFETSRLVTLLGPGGVGKTRMAMEIARSRDEDLVVGDLAAVDSGGDIAHALASALGLQAHEDDIVAAIVERLAIGDVFLVLDNCEHMAADVRDFADRLLRNTTRLKILATTRRRLGLSDEHIERIEPLGLSMLDGQTAPSVVLFRDRLAQAGLANAAGDDEVLAEICRLVDGLPLAIELAAGRAAIFGLTPLRDRLREGIPILDAGGGDERRQGTMSALVEWSTELLTPRGRDVFDRLSIFPAGFTLDAAEAALGTGDVAIGLAELVDSSLLVVEQRADAMRYRMLEPIRQVARKHLNANPVNAQAVADAHANWVLLLGDLAEAALLDDDTGSAHRKIDAAHHDIRSAIRMLANRGDFERLDRFARQISGLLAERPDPELFRLIDTATSASVDGRAAIVTLAAAGQGDPAQASAAAHDALDGLEPSDPRWSTITHAAGIVKLYVGDLEAGFQAFASVLENAHASDRDRAESVVAWSLGELFSTGRDRARWVLEEHANVIDGWHLSGLVACTRGEVESDHPEDAIAFLNTGAVEAEEAGATLILQMVDLARLALHITQGQHGEAVHIGLDLVDRLLARGLIPLAWNAIRQVVGIFDGGEHDELALLVRAARDADPRAPRLMAASASLNDARWKASVENRGLRSTNAIRARGASLSIGDARRILADAATGYSSSH